MARRIDLNADLGESFGSWRMGDDEAMLEIVSSANIACGFHAGDPQTMLRASASAAERGVAIGAHVSYRDLHGFGRRSIRYEKDELIADVLYQFAALDGLARTVGASVAYVKPHGALYNDAQRDDELAAWLVEAMTVFGGTSGNGERWGVLTQPNLALASEAASAGLRVHTEGFPDRGYLSDGTLAPRSVAGAVLHDPSIVAARAGAMALGEPFDAFDGGEVTVKPDSLCLHGDNPAAVENGRRVREALTAAGFAIASPWCSEGHQE